MNAESSQTWEPDGPEFRFSSNAKEVLDRAQSLAEKSGRAGVTSSCLLFAFAEFASSGNETARFVRTVLNRNRGYQEAFHVFLKDSGSAERQSASAVRGFPGKMSRNMRGVLEKASEIAMRVSRSPEIHARHLLAGLLVAPEIDGPLKAWIRLENMGVSSPAYLGELREFLRTLAPADNPLEWDAILSVLQPQDLEVQSPDPNGSALAEARKTLGLDDQAVDFLTYISAAARQINRPVDSFAALALLMGWGEHGTDHSGNAVTQALVSQSQGRTTSTAPADLLDLPAQYMPTQPDLVPTVVLSSELISGLQATHICVERMQMDGFLRFRVLLAVVLSKEGLAKGYAAPARLKELGYQLDLVRAFYRRWLNDYRGGDPAIIYDELLGSLQQSDRILNRELPVPKPLDYDQAAFRKTYSAYAPDRATYGKRDVDALLDDEMGVGVYAGHLAQLIAAKETWMPLSIGLFGAWGAGKSYFIDLIDQHLRSLTRDPGKVFHEQIVQIRFNAWHYLDTNLWANLVCEIFDQLFAKLDKRQDTTKAQVDKLKGELAKQSALAVEAKEALKIAEIARLDAETKLRTAIQERAVEEGKVGALLDDLKKLVIDEHVRQQLRAAAEGLGLPKLQTSFAELETRAEEVRSLTGRMKALTLVIFTGPGWWRRGLLLVAALVLPLGVAWLAQHGPEWIKVLLEGAGRTIAQVVAVITALLAWLSFQAKAGKTLLANLDSAYDKVKQVRARREAQDDAALAQKMLAAKRQAEEEARHSLREAEEKMKAISAELAELAPGRQLIRFLKDRASAEDYRRHLGLVSLVRRDFEQLSLMLTKAGETKDPSLPQIDRIVLYIDDLDRCRADRVIEVLEAVHLLLAFPLFAVVVAVDPRWLRQSLLDHYPRLLGGSEDHGRKLRRRALGRPATAQDYLEKVFQVPFNIQPMEKTGFEALVGHLFPVAQATAKNEMPASVGAASVTREGPAPNTPAPTTVPTAAVVQQPNIPSLPAAHPGKPKSPPDPQRLALTKKEVADVQRFQPLFQTPRALKRLANTYCLIRVGVEEGDWGTYLGSQETPGMYRVPMLLLAVSSAFPALARPWLLWLQEAPPKQWQLANGDLAALANKHADTTDSADWDRLGHCLDQLMLQDWTKPEPAVLAKWVPRVARYSF